MARASTLKVYRTPIGFHDAYVAAPSQKAAIEAWGVDKGIFARKEAELVTDPALTAEPLASPGVVFKRLRGTAAEQIAALGPGAETKESRKKAAAVRAKPEKKKPRPSRDALEAAEMALTKAKERQAEERKAMAEREAELARERRAMEKAQADETARLKHVIDKAEAAYEEALRRWRG